MRRRNIGLHLIFCLSILTGNILQAQDIHFSQIHASPTQLNPSLTGLFNSEYRFIANYKNQWKTVTANYNTYFASLDGKVLYLRNKNFVSAGLQVYSDKAGDLNYSKKQANLSLSIVKSLSRVYDNYLCVGVQGGFINQSVDYSRAHVLDAEYDPSFQNASSSFAFDLTTGVTWYLKTRKFLVYAGSAFHHINQPDISLGGATSEKLYSKYVFHGGAEIAAFENKIMLMPSLIYFYQGPHREVNIGGYVRHKLSSGEENQSQRRFFYYGAWFRWYYSHEFNSGADAMILSVRLDNNSFTYAVSYDLTVSSLTSASKTAGSPELSLIYLIDSKRAGQLSQKSKHPNISCPVF